ncbi:hypothetical protein G9A89_009161 [Geosiphon pyriformis]|nr:hypothetical protein G9A89_009161 [Geosiphon pyriformis]
MDILNVRMDICRPICHRPLSRVGSDHLGAIANVASACEVKRIKKSAFNFINNLACNSFTVCLHYNFLCFMKTFILLKYPKEKFCTFKAPEETQRHGKKRKVVSLEFVTAHLKDTQVGK